MKIKNCPPVAWVDIDLKALKSNFKAIKRFAGKDTSILAVVKADAYGHGLQKAARTLNKEKIEFFGVSDINEGIALRQAGIKKRILMLESALPTNAKYLVEHNITPVVCTLELVLALDRIGAKKKKKIAVHIKIDTGMGRLGVCQAHAIDFIKAVKNLEWIIIEGICTHFPVADTNKNFTKYQISVIKRIVAQIKKEVFTIKYVHAANSMGFAAFGHKGFNLARTGLMLYGLYPSPRIKNRIKLKPVMSVKARVCFVKSISKGRGISYGHTFVASKKMRVATISIGYHDGYFRKFSNQTSVLIKGKRCPVIGTVTMDQIMADVSRLKNIKVGDEVCILGRQGREEVTADELAWLARTISYEITCSLGRIRG
ncbi:MAG: alanine racemase [Candidatus Aceula meridiana]|nr:alanine racemase [Candidatus Aceula meridiana]